MSVIQKLRNKSGLITIIIGIALLSFVITGLDSSIFRSGNDNIIAEINGEEYPYEAYYEIFQQVDKQYRSNPNMAPNQQQLENIPTDAWQMFLNSKLFEKQYEVLGLGVYNDNYKMYGICDKEFEDITIGNNIDPQLQYSFTNQQTGQFDKQQLIQTLTNIKQFKEQNPEMYENWLQFERSLHTNTLLKKYSALISKGYYVTKLETEMSLQDKNSVSDIEYVKIPYESIPDKDIKVSDEDIAKYYEKVKNSKKYKQKETAVNIEYVSFDIVPTKEDILNLEKSVKEKAKDFVTAKNDAMFLNLNSDIAFDPNYYKKGTLPPKIDSFAFASSIDNITPVYLEGNTYKIAKVSDIKMAADSAKVRHILVAGNDAMKKADSLKTVIEKGADFGMMAYKYSADSGSAKMGGLIDWFKDGQMVKSFQDTSFFGVKGKLYLAPSQYGVHIIEILDQGPKSKRVQVQFLAKNITYSQETRKEVYKKAVQFASENRTKQQFNAYLAKNPAITKRIAENVAENERFIPGVFETRDVIRWAHQNKENLDAVSDIFTCGDKFIIATIASVSEKGIVPLEVVKNDLKLEVIKEKKKELIQSKLQGITNSTPLSQIGSKFNVLVQQSQNISFAMTASPELGMEPKVFATATLLAKGAQSQAIEGNAGVYFIKVVDKRKLPNTADIKLEKQMIQQQAGSSISNAVHTILQDKAEIVDNRIKFN